MIDYRAYSSTLNEKVAKGQMLVGILLTTIKASFLLPSLEVHEPFRCFVTLRSFFWILLCRSHFLKIQCCSKLRKPRPYFILSYNFLVAYQCHVKPLQKMDNLELCKFLLHPQTGQRSQIIDLHCFSSWKFSSAGWKCFVWSTVIIIIFTIGAKACAPNIERFISKRIDGALSFNEFKIGGVWIAFQFSSALMKKILFLIDGVNIFKLKRKRQTK